MTTAVFLNHTASSLLQGLCGVLEEPGNEVYTRPSRYLSGATIGQHVRHVAEIFVCLLEGYDTGVIRYDARQRDLRTETDPAFALRRLLDISGNLLREDRSLSLVSDDEPDVVFSSSYYRELWYNIEHTIHHMALIRVALTELSSIVLPEDFGVAPSTIKYRRGCAR